MTRWLMILAVLGLIVATIVVVMESRGRPPETTKVATKPPPFPEAVAGLGTIEAATQDVSIGTPASGIVTEVDVKPGDRVQAGETLVKIDARDVQARLASAQARADEARGVLARAEHELGPVQALARQHVVGAVELTRRRDDVAVSRSAVAVAEAQVGELRAEISRRDIRAPMAGRILRVNVRPGELAASDVAAGPLVVLGDDQALRVRVEIDERDASRVGAAPRAVAMPRGNPQVRMPLRFERIEPYVAPKAVLSGRSGERTDVRVLQVIFALDRPELPVYVGQEVDVLMEASAAPAAK